jgi:tRNA (mo5U34)-methyltransferase
MVSTVSGSRTRAQNWYHSIELPSGEVTPGIYDCRPVEPRLPWPSIRGLRCLDVGTHDGFWAFAMERRGAASVVAIDLDDPALRDWPADVRTAGPERLMEWDWVPGKAFREAANAIGSKVERRSVNVYDLRPEEHGTFDLAFVGNILLHLRDPIRALEAVRSVSGRWLLACETLDPKLQALAPRVPAARFDGIGMDHQWWRPNLRGLAGMVRSAGFTVRTTTGPFVMPFGRSGWVPRSRLRYRLRNGLATGEFAWGTPVAGVLAERRD